MKALVLAGGGARGSYQMGVWQALRQLGWQPDIITGTSIGSLNGAMLTAGLEKELEQLWLTMTLENIVALPEDWENAQNREDFLKDLIRGGGLNVTPLQNRIDEVLSESAVRRSPIRFGLVAVEMRRMKAHELTIDEIPRGKLRDYLLASSACFPAFRPREIDGVKYIDGGYSDNMPFNLAARMGAEELLCVDLSGVGITRWNHTGLPTTTISSRWNLGGLLTFSAEAARRNMALGRLDTLRAYGRYFGEWYAIEPDTEALSRLGDALGETLAAAAARLVGGGLGSLAESAVTLAETLDLNRTLMLPLLEGAAREAELDPTLVYTPRQLADEIKRALEPDTAELRQQIFGGRELELRESAHLMARLPQLRRAIICQALQ